MPIFEYRCADCGAVSEFLLGVFAEQPELCCRACRGSRLQKLFSRPARVALKRESDSLASCGGSPGSCPSGEPCSEACPDYDSFDDFDD